MSEGGAVPRPLPLLIIFSYNSFFLSAASLSAASRRTARSHIGNAGLAILRHPDLPYLKADKTKK